MSRKPNPELFRFVQIIDCEPRRADKPKGEKMAVIRLTCGKQLMHPLMVTISDTQKLVVRLLEVLVSHDAGIPNEIADVLLRINARNERLGKDTLDAVRPSKRKDAPIEPIKNLEMARFFRKCGNAKNDAELLRLIGLTDVEIGKPRCNYPKRKKRP